jgi:hypothetical protein
VNSARVWIVLLAGVMFLAGLAAGTLIEGRRLRGPEHEGPMPAFEARFLRDFELSPERSRALRTVLASYEVERARIERRHRPDYHAAMEPELAALGTRYHVMIRDKVLPARERTRFDDAVAGLPIEPVRR